jgi:hypothetical protein
MSGRLDEIADHLRKISEGYAGLVKMAKASDNTKLGKLVEALGEGLLDAVRTTGDLVSILWDLEDEE